MYQIFKPLNSTAIQNLHHEKESMDMTLNELKLIISTCSNEKKQPLTIDMTKEKYTGRYRLGLNSIFIPHTNPFQTL